MKSISGFITNVGLIIVAHLISCGTDDFLENLIPPCVPGTREICVFGVCSSYYEDCLPDTQPNEADQSTFYSTLYKVNKNSKGPTKVGDTVFITMYFNFPKTAYDKIDSVTWHICNDILDRKVTFPYSKIHTGESFNTIADTVEIIIKDTNPSGVYTIKSSAWTSGSVFKTMSSDFSIYPKEESYLNCYDENKITLIAYLPLNTPANSTIQIRRLLIDDPSLYNTWPFETDTAFYMNKVNDYIYCVSLDFRGGEFYRIYRDGEDSKCWSNSGSAVQISCQYGNYSSGDGPVVFEYISGWLDSYILAPANKICN